MKKITVLLICGSGASTGFMAANMRKAAKAMELEMNVSARSETEVEAYADDVDCIMLGTHLSYLEEEMKERTKDSACVVFVMDKSYYSTLDGKAAIADLMKHLENK